MNNFHFLKDKMHFTSFYLFFFFSTFPSKNTIKKHLTSPQYQFKCTSHRTSITSQNTTKSMSFAINRQKIIEFSSQILIPSNIYLSLIHNLNPEPEFWSSSITILCSDLINCFIILHVNSYIILQAVRLHPGQER